MLINFILKLKMDFNQNNTQHIISSDFPPNNVAPVITNDFPQNYNTLMMPNGYAQNCNSPPINPNDFPYNQNQYNAQNNRHLNNYGYFYIMPNTFMNLESQQKIIINTKQQFGFSPIRFAVVIFFFILFGVGGFLTVMTEGATFPIVIIAFIGFGVSGAWSSGACNCCTPKSSVYYNINNKNLEINCSKKIITNLDSINKIIMEDNDKGSIFYIITKSGEKTEFLKLPLVNGVPFKEGEEILNDFIDYWKKKEGFSQTPVC